MPKTQSFKDLLVWQKSKQFTKNIYKTFSTCKDFGFKDQIQRASVSIMNNIAEGYARKSDKGFKNFLQISKGSAAEVESMLSLAKELSYIDENIEAALSEQSIQLQKMLTTFINKLTS